MDIQKLMQKKMEKRAKQGSSSDSAASSEEGVTNEQAGNELGTTSEENSPSINNESSFNEELEASIKESMDDPNYLGLVPMDSIDLQDQVRGEDDKYTDDELLELALCIRTEGLFKPVVLIPKEDGRFDVEQGEHRFRSFDLLRKNEMLGGEKTHNRFQYNFIPARKSEGKRVPIRQLKENLFHKGMAPLNEAKVVKYAMDEYGWNQERAAKEFNKNQSWISRRLSLLKNEDAEIESAELETYQPIDGEASEKAPSSVPDESQKSAVQPKPKAAKKQAKKTEEKVVRVPVEKTALHDVCKLLAILSDKHGLGEITVKSNPTNLDIKKTIEQRIAEVLNAESNQ